MAEGKKKRGGARPGAGRPHKIEGCPTKVMRVPSYMKESIETLIRVQAEWLSEDEAKKPIGYLDEAEEMKRLKLVQGLTALLDYEKKRREKAKKRAQEENDNKRQMKLFPNDN